MVSPFNSCILNETRHGSFTKVSGMDTLPTDSFLTGGFFPPDYTIFNFFLHFYQSILFPLQPPNVHVEAAQILRTEITSTQDISA